MKKIISLLFLTLLIASCADNPSNGKLDGIWQLMSIEYADGTEVEIKEEKRYYSVQYHLMAIRQAYGEEYIARFNHTDDSLFIYDVRINFNRDNSRHATLEELAPFGLSTEAERFSVETLSRKKMTLKSEYSTLFFRKF